MQLLEVVFTQQLKWVVHHKWWQNWIQVIWAAKVRSRSYGGKKFHHLLMIIWRWLGVQRVVALPFMVPICKPHPLLVFSNLGREPFLSKSMQLPQWNIKCLVHSILRWILGPTLWSNSHNVLGYLYSQFNLPFHVLIESWPRFWVAPKMKNWIANILHLDWVVMVFISNLWVSQSGNCCSLDSCCIRYIFQCENSTEFFCSSDML